jgi:hypothetical protein
VVVNVLLIITYVPHMLPAHLVLQSARMVHVVHARQITPLAILALSQVTFVLPTKWYVLKLVQEFNVKQILLNVHNHSFVLSVSQFDAPMPAVRQEWKIVQPHQQRFLQVQSHA